MPSGPATSQKDCGDTGKRESAWIEGMKAKGQQVKDHLLGIICILQSLGDAPSWSCLLQRLVFPVLKIPIEGYGSGGSIHWEKR